MDHGEITPRQAVDLVRSRVAGDWEAYVRAGGDPSGWTPAGQRREDELQGITEDMLDDKPGSLKRYHELFLNRGVEWTPPPADSDD